MITTVEKIGIKDVQFVGSSAMLISLSNNRTFIVPLDSFERISNLSTDEKKNFEIIDDENLSFLSIDEIYSVHELIGF